MLCAVSGLHVSGLGHNLAKPRLGQNPRVRTKQSRCRRGFCGGGRAASIGMRNPEDTGRDRKTNAHDVRFVALLILVLTGSLKNITPHRE